MSDRFSASLLANPKQPEFQFELISKTVVRLSHSENLCQSAYANSIAPQAFLAMQRLVELLQQLRSPESGWPSDRVPEPETLLPYVSEEAYDVLDTLFHHCVEASYIPPLYGSNLHSPLVQKQSSSLTPRALLSELAVNTLPLDHLILVETLIPQLLWSVVRSAYPIMQMIEGIPAQCRYLGDRTWNVGMLRLVVMLQITTPHLDWCFDLATSCPPGATLASESQIYSPDNLLPIQHQSSSLGQDKNAPIHQVEQQIQALLQQIQAATPTLVPYLQGLPIDWLQPSRGWQSGTLQLKLAFEFIPDATATPDNLPLVEAGLAENGAMFPSPVSFARPAPGVEAPTNPVSEATLIRLTDPTLLDHYKQEILHRCLVSVCDQMQLDQMHRSTDTMLLTIVKAADQVVESFSNAAGRTWNLLQPMLLIDELLPRLLWQITGSSYEVMPLVGGVEAHVLQPGGDWQQGMLRIAAILTLETAGMSYGLDLATGQAISNDFVALAAETVIQSNAIKVCQSAIQLEALSAYLLQMMQMPEILLLEQGVQGEWLQSNQDWQPTMLKLQIGLQFRAETSENFG